MKFSITAKVIKGQNIGHTIGFPTANLDKVPSESDLKPGVYSGECWIGSSSTKYKCLAYFGPRHIFGETKNVFEVHILDFSGDLYDQELNIKLNKFIRKPEKIKSLEKLKEQLKKDKETSLSLRDISPK